MDLLFILAHWHALAKLRQHTDLSLAVLESVTTQLGESMRNFREETAGYDTRELKREEAARLRRAAGASTAASKPASENAAGATEPGNMSPSVVSPPDSQLDSIPEKPSSRPKKYTGTGRQKKTLNLNTYKDHSLGDYVETIRRYGTVDSYSTESVNYCIFASSLNPYSTPLD